jgi:hypothetical protein
LKQIEKLTNLNFQIPFHELIYYPIAIRSSLFKFINSWKVSIKFNSNSTPWTFPEFKFEFYSEFWKVPIRKVVPYLIPYKSLFYLKILEEGKSTFESNQFKPIWIILNNYKTSVLLDRPTPAAPYRPTHPDPIPFSLPYLALSHHPDVNRLRCSCVVVTGPQLHRSAMRSIRWAPFSHRPRARPPPPSSSSTGFKRGHTTAAIAFLLLCSPLCQLVCKSLPTAPLDLLSTTGNQSVADLDGFWAAAATFFPILVSPASEYFRVESACPHDHLSPRCYRTQCRLPRCTGASLTTDKCHHRADVVASTSTYC